MASITYSPVRIQTSSQSVPSIPSWFGEVTLIAHFLRQQGALSAIEERVRFARRRFGHYEVIDFVAVLLGYAISGERTLETFYERLQPFAKAFIALFGRDRLPVRSTLSRFLAALDQAPVGALRTLFLEDLVACPLEKEEKPGGLWDRQGNHWLVFDVDGTRQSARQRALPCTPDLPPAQRRLDEVCAPGYLGRKRGECVRTRTTVLQTHTHQWIGTFSGTSGAGNGDYRGELRQAVQAISGYVKAQSVPLSLAVVRLDGQYGNGAIVADLAGLPFVMRGKDYGLLDLPQVQARLALPPDQQTTHPETGTCRALFDCPDLPLTPTGPRTRVIVATHAATTTAAPIGTTRGEVAYELFFTACRWVRSPLPMWWISTCIEERSSASSLMKIRSKILTAGVRTPPAGKRFGKSSANGCGTCASSLGIASIQLPCAPPNSLLLRCCLILSLDHPNQQTFPTDRRSGHANRTPKDLPEPISLYKLMERCAVQRGNPCMRKNVVPNVMAPCGCCMPRGSVIAERVRCASAVKNPEQPLSNRDASVPYSGLSMGHLLNLPFRLRFLHLLTRSCGKIGAGARRDASG